MTMQNTQRPKRIRIIDFQGRSCTLAHGIEAYVSLKSSDTGSVRIFCGIGPNPEDFTVSNQEFAGPTYYVESEYFCKAIHKEDPLWQNKIPVHWQSINIQEALHILSTLKADQGQIFWYKANMRLDPLFWGPIWGALQGMLLPRQSTTQMYASSSIIVAGHEGQLLHKEVCLAASTMGYTVHCPQNDAQLRALLCKEQPQLCISINGRGLLEDGGYGLTFALLQHLRIPTALWFVDNPWHVLSGVKGPWWKKAHLFVTDASFIAALQREGAKSVHHAPLATAQHMWAAANSVNAKKVRTHAQRAEQAQCIFVGHAAFAHKEKFFAAAKVPEECIAQAMRLLAQKELVTKPHFHWWAKRLALTSFWPTHTVRNAGFGAEQCAMQHRVLWLQGLLSLDVAVFGDAHTWQALLPQAPKHIFYPEVDYYTELADIYAHARSVLNVTSLLLPEGLTQRHFDVWAAGGFLFSDASKALDIFPKNITKPISIKGPQYIANAVQNLSNSMRQELIFAWQETLRQSHTYEHRIQLMLDCCVE